MVAIVIAVMALVISCAAFARAFRHVHTDDKIIHVER